MAKSKHLFQDLVAVTDNSYGTMKLIGDNLRKAGQLPVSKRGAGATDFDSAATINLLLATLLAPTASRAVETVQHVATFPLRHAPDGALVKASAFGIGMLDKFTTAFTALLDAFRCGKAPRGRVVLDIYGAESAIFSFIATDDTDKESDFVLYYGPEKESPTVTKFVRIDDRLLRILAETLGPLPVATPPPY